MSNNEPVKPESLAEADFNKPWEYESSYEVIRTVSDPRFGEIKIYKHKESGIVMLAKEKVLSGKNDAANGIVELRKRIALNHPSLQRLSNYSTSVKKELCSTNYISRSIYEYPHSDLQREINENKKANLIFHPNELAHLAYQILQGLEHLHSHGITHGDIRPMFIGFNRATKHFYLLDRLNDNSPLEKVQANNIIGKKDLFLSPQLNKKLQGRDKSVKYSATKNDLFALGLCIILAGNNQAAQDIYLPNGEFNEAKLAEHLGAFEQRFKPDNPHLINIVRHLLKINEDERLEAKELLGKLPAYEEYKQQEQVGFIVARKSNNNNLVNVQSTPVDIVQVSPNETHFVQVQTKVSYGQPTIRTYMSSQPNIEFDPNQYQNMKQYTPPDNVIYVPDESVTFVKQDPTTHVVQSNALGYAMPGYVYAPVTVQGQSINSDVRSYDPIVTRTVVREDEIKKA